MSLVDRSVYQKEMTTDGACTVGHLPSGALAPPIPPQFRSKSLIDPTAKSGLRAVVVRRSRFSEGSTFRIADEFGACRFRRLRKPERQGRAGASQRIGSGSYPFRTVVHSLIQQMTGILKNSFLHPRRATL